MEAIRTEEQRLRTRFSRVRAGMPQRRVQTIMNHAPDWQHGDSWGYVFVLRVEGVSMQSHPSLVVEFDGAMVSDTYEKPPAPEFMKAIQEDTQPRMQTDAAINGVGDSEGK